MFFLIFPSTNPIWTNFKMYFLGQFLLQLQAKTLKIMCFIWFSHRKIRLSLFKVVKIELKNYLFLPKMRNFTFENMFFTLKCQNFWIYSKSLEIFNTTFLSIGQNDHQSACFEAFWKKNSFKTTFWIFHENPSKLHKIQVSNSGNWILEDLHVFKVLRVDFGHYTLTSHRPRTLISLV